MRIQNPILAGLILLSLMPAFGQTEENAGARNGRAQRAGGGFGGFGGGRAVEPAVDTSALTKFNLDFPGGKPKDLVAAIQKALGKPLNAIVPDEYADIKLPALKMTNISVADLFNALISASAKTVPYATSTYYSGTGKPSYSYQQLQTSYGFRTEGRPTDDSIWYFYQSKPPLPPGAEQPQGRTARFYLLTPYLERGLTVDDITTAIQTGWKMLGEKETPSISFHKETKLLIAVGDASKLDTIDAALRALEPPQLRGALGRRFGGGVGFGGFDGVGSTPSTNTSSAEQPKNDQ